jgi:hypothetical protein
MGSQPMGLAVAVMALAISVLIVVSALRRTAQHRRSLGDDLDRLSRELAALQAERNLLTTQLDESGRSLRDTLIRMDRLDRRLRMYESGSPPLGRHDGLPQWGDAATDAGSQPSAPDGATSAGDAAGGANR